jgi:hypothetical protein
MVLLKKGKEIIAEFKPIEKGYFINEVDYSNLIAALKIKVHIEESLKSEQVYWKGKLLTKAQKDFILASLRAIREG